jgi:hypothetical protein
MSCADARCTGAGGETGDKVMTHTITTGMDGFRAVMDGPVILPGDPGFDDGRRV